MTPDEYATFVREPRRYPSVSASQLSDVDRCLITGVDQANREVRVNVVDGLVQIVATAANGAVSMKQARLVGLDEIAPAVVHARSSAVDTVRLLRDAGVPFTLLDR